MNSSYVNQVESIETQLPRTLQTVSHISDITDSTADIPQQHLIQIYNMGLAKRLLHTPCILAHNPPNL